MRQATLLGLCLWRQDWDGLLTTYVMRWRRFSRVIYDVAVYKL